MSLRVLSVGSMFPPHHLGGAELIWHSAVAEQRRRGWEVEVLTTDHREQQPDPAIPEDPRIRRELRWYWADHQFPRLGLRERLAVERHNRRLLRERLASFRPHAINWWSMGGLSLALLQQGRAARVPSVGVVLDDWMVYGPDVDGWQRACRRLGPLGRLAGRLAGVPSRVEIGAAADWIFMSATVQRHAREAGVDVAGSKILFRGIDAKLFDPGPRTDGRWGGRLLCLGRLDPRKGLEIALRALPELPGCGLEIAGGGDAAYRERLEKVVSELGLGDRVRFTRPGRDEVPARLAAADAVLFCVQWEEPWGLVPLEAMAAGTPVVASGTGGSAEYLRDGHNCLLYAPRDDPAALARQVRRLEDAELRSRLREGGRATNERFSEAGFNRGVADAVEAAAARGDSR